MVQIYSSGVSSVTRLTCTVNTSLQYRVHRDTVVRPDEVCEIMTEEEYRKARIYRLDKHRFSFVYSIYLQLELMVGYAFLFQSL